VKKVLKLTGPIARQASCRYINEAPEGFIVTISEPTRNLDQNARLWASLTELSEQVDWYGNKLCPEEWKIVLTAALRKEKVVPGINGGFVVLGQSTSKMSKREFSELLELLYAFGAEKGVTFSDQERLAA
jgi:hypothetical protein